MPTSWVPGSEGGPFTLENLPYGSFSPVASSGRDPRVGVAIGDKVLDAGAAAREMAHPHADLLGGPLLNPFMAAGPEVWSETRGAITDWLSDGSCEERLSSHLHPLATVELHLPFSAGDYVDFYSSEHHAINAGRILRPGSDPLFPQWKHLPAGYHGRSGTVVVSGTPVRRPSGQIRPDGGSTEPDFGPTARLDIEAEVGFVVGMPSRPGIPLGVDDFERHVFGVFLLNDWSARDIQAWEYVPLGPFLGKSFQTSVSPWVVPLDALSAARVEPPERLPAPLGYLDDTGRRQGFDIDLEVRLNGHVVSRPPFSTMYWTAAQQLAHMTSNGATVRTGDLYGSGTVSGERRDQVGSFMELSWGGSEPFRTPDGAEHTYLADGDEVVITATAPSPSGGRIGFGEVRGRVEP